MAWIHHRVLRLQHTDCAGRIFFPRLLELAHEAYEALLDELGLPLAAGLDGAGPLLPIVRCEAEFLRPLFLGQAMEIAIEAGREGRCSFTLDYRFQDPAGELLARARSVHVAVDRASGEACPLSDSMRHGLARLRALGEGG
jgi:1,4-dihydroxy-2-naphthoyl-CoA hydrolase